MFVFFLFVAGLGTGILFSWFYFKRRHFKVQSPEQESSHDPCQSSAKPLETELHCCSLVDHFLFAVGMYRILYDEAGKAYDYEIYRVNPLFAQYLNQKYEKFLNRPSCSVLEICTPLYWDEFYEVVQTGKPKKFHSFDPELQKHLRITVLCHAPHCFATVIEDISAQVETEKAKEELIQELGKKNQELESYAYTVSHDLRSPLVTIQGFASEILGDLADQNYSGIEDSCSFIVNASKRMSKLLDGILKLSRIGKMSNPPELFSLEQLLNELQESLQGPLKNTDCVLEIEAPMPEIFSDPQRIQEILQNLIENAIKYRRTDIPAQVKVSYAQKAIFHQIIVSDNGIGIIQEDLKRIFDLFQKINTKSDGIGLGLTMVKRLAENLGGNVQVTSPGYLQGSTFTVEIPRTQPPFKKTAQASKA